MNWLIEIYPLVLAAMFGMLLAHFQQFWFWNGGEITRQLRKRFKPDRGPGFDHCPKCSGFYAQSFVGCDGLARRDTLDLTLLTTLLTLLATLLTTLLSGSRPQISWKSCSRHVNSFLPRFNSRDKIFDFSRLWIVRLKARAAPFLGCEIGTGFFLPEFLCKACLPLLFASPNREPSKIIDITTTANMVNNMEHAPDCNCYECWYAWRQDRLSKVALVLLGAIGLAAAIILMIHGPAALNEIFK